jgi:hypothetical protein
MVFLLQTEPGLIEGEKGIMTPLSKSAGWLE